ncbi:MAG: HD-GYP domain-containing protein [Candidatus Eisenbacteria bacterium]|nr:HD-GYP domain-containing protein [Candidatus Eisenbacteria bacterium]
MSSSRSDSIVDLKPFLAKFRRSQAPQIQSDATLDFEDLVGDAPSRPEHSGTRAAGLTVTWRLFLGFLGMSLAIGAITTPLILVIDPLLSREHLLLVGLLIYTSSILTATSAYWLVRGLVGRWLQALKYDQTLIWHRAAAGIGASSRGSGVQATELDQLVDTVSGLVDELKYQLDSKQRTERNDLIRTITALATALEARDPHTQNHSKTVARLSVRLGRHVGLRREELYEIHLAGLLHDIGKIAVPDEILMKPGRLTEEEMRQVQAHVEWSWNILAPITMLGSVALMVRHHHERYDGKGYPDRLSGEAIPLGARIMAVADMFVAMTEDRPYRKGLPIELAVAELHRVAGSQVDPALVTAFLACLEEDDIHQPAESISKRAAAN